MSLFTELRALVALDDLGSLTAAAEYLQVSKSSLSRRIARLEENLNTPLTLEERGRLVLSRAGLCYVDYARQILHTVRDSQAALQCLRHEVSGEIRVRLCPDLSSGWIISALNEFLSIYPKVRLLVSVTGRPQGLGQSDVQLVCGQAEEMDGFKCIELGNWQRCLYMSRKALSSKPAPQQVQQLKNMQWIGKSNDEPNVVLRHSSNGQSHSLHANMRLQVATLSMLAEALADSECIGLLPTWVVECKRYGIKDTFERCLPEWNAEPLKLAAYVRQQDRSYSVRTLVSFLQQNMPQRWSSGLGPRATCQHSIRH